MGAAIRDTWQVAAYYSCLVGIVGVVLSWLFPAVGAAISDTWQAALVACCSCRCVCCCGFDCLWHLASRCYCLQQQLLLLLPLLPLLPLPKPMLSLHLHTMCCCWLHAPSKSSARSSARICLLALCRWGTFQTLYRASEPQPAGLLRSCCVTAWCLRQLSCAPSHVGTHQAPLRCLLGARAVPNCPTS